MDRSVARAKVVELVADTLDRDPSQIVESASFETDLDADSLDLIELVMAFEEEFGVEIPEDDVASIKTVGDTVDYLLSHSA